MMTLLPAPVQKPRIPILVGGGLAAAETVTAGCVMMDAVFTACYTYRSSLWWTF